MLCAGRGFNYAGLRLGSRLIVFPASMFNDILASQVRSPTSRAFEGNALVHLPQATRGRILQSLARSVDSEINPGSDSEDAASGRCVNGDRRGANRTEYDWRRDGQRIECKSAMMLWVPSQASWQLHFAGVKLALHDELLLVCLCPCAIYIYRHDRQFAVSSHGFKTRTLGHQILVRGPSGVEQWSDARDAILGKLDDDSNGCARLAVVSNTDARLEALLHETCGVTRLAFKQRPLSDLSSGARGLHIEELVRRVDTLLHPEVTVNAAAAGSCRSVARRRGAHQAEYDWCRGNVRVECKSSQLQYEPSQRRWKFSFSKIKLSRSPEHTALFDELLLGLYTPHGVYIYRHDLVFGLSTSGASTVGSGYQVQVYGPSGVVDWKVALDAILRKFDASGCQRIAVVQW
ncbi:unnamed protein product [Prorocentrum cordatum]|uniref:CDAN1-interacting nuclease 1 n=1 Tax=Prorocentrum cordatum TaxID=2364126 RepID=A0ABN9W4K8_9DINO|nr:unnamed protein product [Polarella glacialis]